MNEGTKTGIFWTVAVVMIAIAALVAWPRTSDEPDTIAGQMLFEKFTDPLAAASMKIVTFDEEQGQLETFEVRKDRESDLWTIPSRDGYPADAIEQMKDAANALVGLKILDIQTSNAEDHDDLGVAEPRLEDLEVGDEGVGRLVTFKNDSQESLASLIIGDALKDDAEKRYVRIPGQDPVYVVKLDEGPLTTQFQDWIEDDLLQLSSIDISDMEIKDYSTALNMGGQISLTRNYTANVVMDGSQWKLDKLVEYDPKNPMAEPKQVDVGEEDELNKTKLDAMKNALDDLKIADVVRKPEGMSANLRANQDLLSDKDAVGSLAQRGFYPVPTGRNGEVEILSANGELSVALKDGVKYIMRFGNIAGVSDKDSANASDGDAESDDVDAGVNRYLLVTTIVDESKFPPPELRAVPQNLEELDAILNPKSEEPAEAPPAEEEPAEKDAGSDDAESEAKTETMKDADAEKKPASEESEAETAPKKEEPAEKEEPAAQEESKSEEPASEPASEPTEPEKSAADADSETSGETETSGSGEATGSGEAQEASEATDDEASADDAKDEPAAETDADQPKQTEGVAAGENGAEAELTAEEKQERLEAEQEKITKENQRKMDERKDKLEAAQRRVAELNARFADWYYVIPEDTYSKLRIKRDELFEQPGAAEAPSGPAPGGAPPQFNFPGVPGN